MISPLPPIFIGEVAERSEVGGVKKPPLCIGRGTACGGGIVNWQLVMHNQRFFAPLRMTEKDVTLSIAKRRRGNLAGRREPPTPTISF